MGIEAAVGETSTLGRRGISEAIMEEKYEKQNLFFICIFRVSCTSQRRKKKKDRHVFFLSQHIVHLSNVTYEDVQTNCHGYREFPEAIWREVKDTLALALLLAGKERT